MGLLSSCCCCCSVRKGSFVSGCYTILYFFAFAVLTGNIAYLEIRTWLGAKAGEDSGGGRSVGGVTRSDVTEANAEQGQSHGDAPEAKFAPSQSPPLSIVVILVDFACELAGFVASIVLLCGLIQEKKALLIPWMVIVPAHTALDVYTSSDILIAFFETTTRQDDEESEHESWRTMILLTAIGITAVINIYALLCVYSQYEDYKAGRGTAASEDMDLENIGPGRSRWLEGRGAGRDELYTTFNTRKHNSNAKSDGVKYLSAHAQEETLSYKDDSEKMPTIQFYEESSNSSPEFTNAQSKLHNSKSSAQKTSAAAMTNNVSSSP